MEDPEGVFFFDKDMDVFVFPVESDDDLACALREMRFLASLVRKPPVSDGFMSSMARVLNRMFGLS